MKLTSPEPSLSLSQPADYNWNAHLSYGIHFHRNVGLMLGAELARYGGTERMTGSLYWMNVVDSEGETYNHQVEIHSFVDRQSLTYINIPIALQLQVPFEVMALEFQLGAKVGIPLSAAASFEGDIEHVGVYPQWGMEEVRNVAGHGFYRVPNFRNEYEIAKQTQCFVFAKAGVSAKISSYLRLVVMVGFDYGVLAGSMPDRPTSLGFKNDNPSGAEYHSFMSPYYGLPATTVMTKPAHPMALTAEVGLRVIIPHMAPRGRCMCEFDVFDN